MTSATIGDMSHLFLHTIDQIDANLQGRRLRRNADGRRYRAPGKGDWTLNSTVQIAFDTINLHSTLSRLQGPPSLLETFIRCQAVPASLVALHPNREGFPATGLRPKDSPCGRGDDVHEKIVAWMDQPTSGGVLPVTQSRRRVVGDAKMQALASA